MILERAFHLASYVTVATALTTFALSSGSYALLALIVALAGLAWFQEERGRARYLTGWQATAISLLGLGGLAVYTYAAGTSYVIGFANYLVILQLVKLFQAKQNRDYLQLYLLSLLHLVVASVLTTALSFSIAFLIYFVAATWALMLFHIRREVAGRSNETASQVRLARVSGRFVASFSGVSVLIFALTLVIFFVVPRLSLGFLQRASLQPQPVAGFSDSVTLAEIGRIKLSRAPVMRVQPPGGRPVHNTSQLWRGKAFDHYTGRGWEVSHPETYWVRADRSGYVKFPGIAAIGGAVRETFRFSVNELSTNVIFMPYYTDAITSRNRAVAVDVLGAVYSGLPHYAGVGYVTHSHSASSDALLPSPAFRDTLREYLMSASDSSPVTELARRVTAGKSSDLERAAAIERYLRRTYRYTLDLKSSGGRDPVEYFLFERRAGHCELFASSMVMMVRAIGIPARYVTGFSGGEWNEFGKYFLVRQLDAHAWVEVYTPKIGWAPFDPTPFADVEQGLGMFAGLGVIPRFLDSLRVRWNAYIIDYSHYQQRRFTMSLRSYANRAGGWMRHTAEQLLMHGKQWISDLRRARWFMSWAGFGVIVSLLLVAVGLRWLLLRRRRAVSLPPEVSNYGVFLRLLERRQLRKPPALTPAEFANMLRAYPSIPRAAVDRLTTGYYSVRYGQAPRSSADIAAEQEALAELQAALKRTPVKADV